MNVPKLRFKEFKDDWNLIRLGDCCNLITKGTTPNRFSEYGIKFIKIESLINKKIDNNKCLYVDEITHITSLKRSVLEEKDVLFAIAGATIGKCGIIEKENLPSNTNQALAILRTNQKKLNPYFLLNVLDSNIMKKYILLNISVGAQPNLNLEQMNNFKFKLPSEEEQLKVANFLSLLDKKIELQSKKIEDLKLFKLYTKNQIFKDYDEICKLKAILVKWNKKNKNNSVKYVESISNKYGFISQSDQFEDRNVASKNLNNYYIIEKGVFGYNPSRLNVGSLALKTNDKVSVVSPLYECFTTSQNNQYLLEWFDSKYFRKETMSKFEGGVRNTLNFSNLCEIEIGLPTIEKQNKYSRIFKIFNNKIEFEVKKLYKLQELKKGLMQSMFV